ncbi:MAG: tRNA-dihydrouridine synthase family protein [Oscillospiraceae bacterium]|nr:tRNA-dihydrouridine synthase family protein [Oscillospiraceae bacterium]
MMIFECAPMEGVTDFSFRQVQSRLFTAADRYYTPFISPTATRLFTPRQLRELVPEHNEGICLIPQLIGHDAGDFLWAARELREMGYREVNFNLGCPSGTVVSKKKGAGLLSEPELLRSFFDEVFEHSPVDISVKTRIGRDEPEEFSALLELFGRYPIRELIIHPRLQTQKYKGSPHLDVWRRATEESRAPLCYNGDIFDRARFEGFMSEFPGTERIMTGRGLAANPGLIGELKGEAPLTKQELEHFHAELLDACRQRIGQETPLLLHMKELWLYMSCCFADAEKPLKALRKSRTLADYSSAVHSLFRDCELRQPAGFTV